MAQKNTNVLWQTKEYTLYADSVVQNKYKAKAISANEITSNYQSPLNEYQSTKIEFKFSINGKDNELKFAINHNFNVLKGVTETPIIKFGEQLKDNTGETNTFMEPNTKLTIRLDMNSVLKDLNTQGYYTTLNGDKIFKEDFKGLYLAGGAAPMMWDFDNLHNKPELTLKDDDGDGIYETTITLNPLKKEKETASQWLMSKDISAFPQYKSPHAIADAIYNMSIEEMIKAVEPDSTFRTGKEWAGVWTRDISYSIILSMAYLQPEVAKKSLLRKVNKKKRIIQDTGTGGAYPCSTDRMIWATAAWEIYKATGDKDWLQQAYEIIKNSVDDDMSNAYDASTGLVRGESSFLDWREQTYPKWMQPADIFESENLGTNAVHYQANIVLAEIGKILNKQSDVLKYKANAAKIKTGINKYLWLKDKGYYAQYLYGRNNKIVSPRSEALGEALCVLFGIADEPTQKRIIESTPVTDYGIPCIYPQIPGIAAYHNNAVWPFVQSYWGLASAKVGNETSVMESIAAIYRPAALFVTNKENFVADNGDFAGTVINSSNMLWSLSGNISLIHKIIFGIEFQADKLVFHPFVPKALEGKRSLNNFKYQNAVLDISMEGHGNKIRSFIVDGKKMAVAQISSMLKGKHIVKIMLTDNAITDNKINKVANYTTLATPIVNVQNDTMQWQSIHRAKKYLIFKNGSPLELTRETKFIITETCAEYQVLAIDALNRASFASEPFILKDCANIGEYDIAMYAIPSTLNYKGATGKGFVEISKTVNKVINIPVAIAEDGEYAINFRYANGNGPVNTDNKCAIRTLELDKKFVGTVVFPQRGNEEWSNWGYSNSVKVKMKKGKHTITLAFRSANGNMNGDVNQAMIDHMQLVKLN
ncbi:MGH1-like glycoside hydrolase domain-containing protein [Ferruginibacter sp. SUN002]|uniref:alpha-L-rhamnosidase-related protein n=1 Tax=Ferruginibacter sp. SUN002 TaxID=2937789 RepID=UPI003D360900